MCLSLQKVSPASSLYAQKTQQYFSERKKYTMYLQQNILYILVGMFDEWK